MTSEMGEAHDAPPVAMLPGPTLVQEGRTSYASQQKRVAAFWCKQKQKRKWIFFRDIASWCCRESGSVKPDEAKREKAYRILTTSILSGDFERVGRSRLLLLNPEDKFTTLTTDEARRIVRSFGDAFPVLTTGYLQWLCVPRDLARGWFAAWRMELPPWLEDAVSKAPLAAKAPVARRKRPPGRWPKYDWEPVTQMVGAELFANGLPVPGEGEQARLEKMARDLFPPDHCPSESLIRKRVSDVMKPGFAVTGHATTGAAPAIH